MDIEVTDRLISFLIFLPLFFVSLAIHEFAHAFTAFKYGDSTAKNEGRLTLNPIKHIDLFGSIIVPVMSFFSGFALIGWAKPVPVDRRNFKNIYRDDAVVSFAGPLSNFLLALLFTFVLVILVNTSTELTKNNMLLSVVTYGIYLNIFLFLFNLLPIPPLDGSHILFDMFPNKLTAKYLGLGIYGGLILILFIYSPLWTYFSQLISFVVSLLLKFTQL